MKRAEGLGGRDKGVYQIMSQKYTLHDHVQLPAVCVCVY